MAKIKVTLDHPIQNGETITFKAPCDCTGATEGMTVYYPYADGSGKGNKTFKFADSHNNDVSSLGNLFAKDALVAVVVNTDNDRAHILNADTNKYVENSFACKKVAISFKAEGSTGWSTVEPDCYKIGKLVHVQVACKSDGSRSMTIELTGMPVGDSAYNFVPGLVYHGGSAITNRVVMGVNSQNHTLYAFFESEATNDVVFSYTYIAAD